jgi:hypothetical protein
MLYEACVLYASIVFDSTSPSNQVQVRMLAALSGRLGQVGLILRPLTAPVSDDGLACCTTPV